jgi:ABC-type glutathione transport system ATPase component
VPRSRSRCAPAARRAANQRTPRIDAAKLQRGPRDAGSIALSGVEIDFGEGKSAVRALNGIDLRIERGEFVSIVGPSGCG